MNHPFQSSNDLLIVTVLTLFKPDYALRATDPWSRISCLHFARGKCKNGTLCPFVHPGQSQNSSTREMQQVDDARSQILCRYFIRGHCRDGEACHYSHSLANEPIEDASPDEEVCISP
jgi:hypothetical protein